MVRYDLTSSVRITEYPDHQETRVVCSDPDSLLLYRDTCVRPVGIKMCQLTLWALVLTQILTGLYSLIRHNHSRNNLQITILQAGPAVWISHGIPCPRLQDSADGVKINDVNIKRVWWERVRSFPSRSSCIWFPTIWDRGTGQTYHSLLAWKLSS